jgi:hypothetical protein
MESFKINYDRQSCPGVILTLKPKGQSTSKQTIHVKSCEHGTDHPDAKGDPLKYTCRKIQLMIKTEQSTKYFQNLP